MFIPGDRPTCPSCGTQIDHDLAPSGSLIRFQCKKCREVFFAKTKVVFQWLTIDDFDLNKKLDDVCNTAKTFKECRRLRREIEDDLDI